MYRILLAFALGLAIKENISKLLTVEGGIAAFETVHWVIVALTVIMIPLCVYTFIYGWKEYNADQARKKAEEEEKQAELANEKFGEVADGSADEAAQNNETDAEGEDGADEAEEEPDSGASKYDI